jgi:hypothetical protein
MKTRMTGRRGIMTGSGVVRVITVAGAALCSMPQYDSRWGIAPCGDFWVRSKSELPLDSIAVHLFFFCFEARAPF